jgi:uncharacterized protein YjiS (DUF1127 family)
MAIARFAANRSFGQCSGKAISFLGNLITASSLQAFHTSRRAAAGRRSGRVIEQAVGLLREWRRRSSGRAKLAMLDDRMLEDIGITRAEAESLSRKPSWRE